MYLYIYRYRYIYRYINKNVIFNKIMWHHEKQIINQSHRVATGDIMGHARMLAVYISIFINEM